MKKLIVTLLVLMSTFTPLQIHANTASGSISGSTNVTAGTQFTLTFAIANGTNVEGVESVINFDSTHFSIVSSENLGSNNTTFFNKSNNKYADIWTGSPKSGTVQFLRIRFEARSGFSVGTKSTISMTNNFIIQNGSRVSVPNRSIELTSIAPLSTVNTLSSITINGNNLSGFSSNITSYTLPSTQDDSITINAVRTDSKSTLSGTGTFSLRYGSNRFNLTVRSESGATRTYSINVNRPDLRGDNTNIKSITIGDQVLTWNSDLSRNILLIPNSTSNGTLGIELEESTSTVTSSTDFDFSVGDNTVEIVVQSEKGTVSTHVIKVVRANDQGAFPDAYTSTQLKHVLIDGTIYLIQQGKITIPYNIETPELVFVAEHELTKIVVPEIPPFVFGDNNVVLEITAFDGTTETVTINFHREDQMQPVSLEELLTNIESYPVNTLSFFYEGFITDEETLTILRTLNKPLRLFVSTSSVSGYWLLSNENIDLLKDIDFGIEEDASVEFEQSIGFITHSNFKFNEANFVQPMSFTLTQLPQLQKYTTLYGYQMTAEGLVLLETWEVLPLSSVIEVGGPLHLVVSPYLIEIPEEPFDIRLFYAGVGAAALGWLFWLIGVVRYSKLKRKFLKSKKGVL